MKRTVRYQGAIIRDDCILLLRHTEHVSGRSYWVIPGGDREPNETGEACIKRKMLEETGLEVQVERLLLDEAGLPWGDYQRIRTYLCRADTGAASPGLETEHEDAKKYSITAVGWLNLRDPVSWDIQVRSDKFTFALLRRIQALLGYRVARWVKMSGW